MSQYSFSIFTPVYNRGGGYEIEYKTPDNDKHIVTLSG